MPILDALLNKLGRPAGRALDPTIRDIVHAVLKEHGYASPAEVQALRDEVRDMRGRVDAMQARLDEVVAMADGARAAAAQARESAESQADARAAAAESSANARVVALGEALAALEAKLASLPVSATLAAAAPPTAEAPRGARTGSPEGEPCRVSGCANSVRSKGFCSSHYQQWRRGTLKDFVGPEGHVSVDGKDFQVPAQLAGGKAELRGGKLYVDGAQA